MADEVSLEELSSRFKWPEYVVFVLVLVVSAGIGIFFGFFGKGQKTTSEFLMAGRSLSTFPVAMSLFASFISAITLLGTPAEMYVYGTQYWVIVVCYIAVMPSASYLYLPVFWHYQPTSAYEYLELRFAKPVRFLGCALFIMQMTIYMAIVVYAPALALSQVTGINVWVAVTGIFFVCIFYTAIGGIRAVVWTDTFQVVIMFGSLMAVVFKGASDLGGPSAIWETVKNGSRAEFFNFNPDPRERHTVWGLIIGGYFTWIIVYGVNQSQVQRYLTVPKIWQARSAIWLNGVGLIAVVSICCYGGLVLYARYQGCDPILSKQVESSNQLFPLFVMETLGTIPGLPGLFVAGIFSGSLSTVSSGLNSLAAIALEDVVKHFWRDMSETRMTNVSKALAVVFGLITFALVVVAAQLGGVLQASISVYGITGGPLLGVFTLGMFFPWANWKGAFAGTLSSLIFMFWLGFGANIKAQAGELVIPKKPFFVEDCKGNVTLARPKPGQTGGLLEFYRISYIWYSMIGFFVVIFIGLVVSFFTGFQDARKLDPHLISPPIDRLMKAVCSERFRARIGWEIGTQCEGGPEGKKSSTESDNPEAEERKTSTEFDNREAEEKTSSTVSDNRESGQDDVQKRQNSS